MKIGNNGNSTVDLRDLHRFNTTLKLYVMPQYCSPDIPLHCSETEKLQTKNTSILIEHR